MTLVVCWLLLPLVLGLLSLGCGVIVEVATGERLPGVLLTPLGFAAIVVVSLFTTASSETARLTTPVIVALALVGLAIALRSRLRRPSGWPVASMLGAYAAFGAPVILSGSATFAGYIKLDDTATWFAFADRLLEHGRSVNGVAPSSYEATLTLNWTGGYPVGAFPPLGVAHELLRTDPAWLFQPYMAFLGAMLALGIYGVLGKVVERRSLRAAAAFVAAQPALLYGYSLWGGVKEVSTAVLLVLAGALAPLTLKDGARLRSPLPLAMATAALIGALSFFGAVWIAPMLVVALVAGLRVRGLPFLRVAAAFIAFVAILSLPTLLLAGDFSASGAALTTTGELGNLYRPLSNLQAFGIWPIGDFRLRPSDIGVTEALIGVVAIAALVGLGWAWRRRQLELVLYLTGAAIGCVVTVALGSPWVGGKALAIASPAALTAAMAGIGWLARRRRGVEAWVALAVIAGGVLWSNALAYHEVWLAPRGQLRELESIGRQFSGGGPTLMTEYSPFGVRHFLRNADPEGASELRRRLDPLRGGGVVPKSGYSDIDQFQLGGVLVYRTLVLVHSPSSSRPPSVYRLERSGRYYDVWQRPRVLASQIIEHVPLGNDVQPAAVPPCDEIRRLGRIAAAHNGRLAAVVRPAVTVVDLSAARVPRTWRAAADSPGAVYPGPSGTLEARVGVPVSGSYGFWIAGSFRRRLALVVDGQTVATAQHHLNHLGVDTPLGQADLPAGQHDIALRVSPADLSPGSGGPPPALGPLVLSRDAAAPPVTSVQPTRADALCGKSLDWIEAVTR